MDAQPIKLNLGCGVGLLGGFINVDLFFTEEQIRSKSGFCKNAEIEEGAVFVRADICHTQFPDNYADYILSSHVIEHMPMRQVIPAMAEAYRILKPGGNIVVLCPDFNGVAKVWADTIATQVGGFKDFDWYHNLAEVIYGNQAGPGEYHRAPITPDYLNAIMQGVGFTNVVVGIRPMGTTANYNDIDGIRYAEGSVMRADEIVARATKQEPTVAKAPLEQSEEAPPTTLPPLGIFISETVKTKDGLR